MPADGQEDSGPPDGIVASAHPLATRVGLEILENVVAATLENVAEHGVAAFYESGNGLAASR